MRPEDLERAAVRGLLGDPELAAISASMSTGPAVPAVPEGIPWPKPLDEGAFHGLAGEIVRAIEPHTEADPAALLVQFLIGFGSVVGRGPHYCVGADLHRSNLFGVLVGPTAKGRKGTAWSVIRHLLESADPEWADKRTTSNLSSGEGVIWAVRDAIEEQEPIREPRTKKITGYQIVTTDTGIQDKRLMAAIPHRSFLGSPSI